MVEGQTHSDRIMDTQQTNESDLSLIDEANAAAARLETANKRAEELARKQEEREIRAKFEGRAAANTPVMKEEESPADYIKRLQRGEL